jgi:GH25 family lysozyme M1 (1,4-beta-N-acetylmuramidase)
MRLTVRRSPVALLVALLATTVFSAPANASFDAPGGATAVNDGDRGGARGGNDVPNGYPGAGRPQNIESGKAGLLAAQPAGYPINGIDVSSNNHNSGQSINWAGRRAAGDEFAYVKATEGTSYVNPFYSQDYNGAKSAGLYTGAYAFARPDLGNAVGQANYLVDHMGWATDGLTLPPFLDLEWPYLLSNGSHVAPYPCYGLSTGQMTSWISTFLGQVQSRIGRTPMIYTNVNWWNPCTGNSTAFSGYGLDISSCMSTPPSVPGWGTRWTFWQYDIPECGRGGTLDSNVFRGSLTELAGLAGGVPTANRAAPAVLAATSGAMTGFAIGTDGHLYTSWQAAAGGTWSGWVPVGSGGPRFTGTPFARIHDAATGAMTVFVTGTDGHVYTSWQTSAGSAWVPFVQISNGNGLVSSPSVLAASNGAMTVFGIASDGHLYTAWQSTPGGTWSNWIPVAAGGPSFTGTPFARIHDSATGAMTIFATGTDGHVYTSWQTSAGGSWVTYLPISSGPSIASGPTVLAAADGRMSAFATGTDGTVYTAWQTAPGSTFTAWTHL